MHAGVQQPQYIVHADLLYNVVAMGGISADPIESMGERFLSAHD